MEINGEPVWTRKTRCRVLVYQPIGVGFVNLARHNRRTHKFVVIHHPNLDRIVIYRFQSPSRQGAGEPPPLQGGQALAGRLTPETSRIPYQTGLLLGGHRVWASPLDTACGPEKPVKQPPLTVIGIEFTSILNRISPLALNRQ